MVEPASAKEAAQPRDQTERLQQTLAELEKERERLVDLTISCKVPQLESQMVGDEQAIMQISDEPDASRRSEALPQAQQTLRQHIDLLTKYNEIKDVATGLIGMIAEARQERIVDVMRSFDLEVND